MRVRHSLFSHRQYSAKEYDQVNNLLLEPVQELLKRYGWPIQQVIYKRKYLFRGAHPIADFLVDAERD